MKLVIGEYYYYWNKSVYERRPSRKECELICIERGRKYARVQRLDLNVNAIQSIEIKRLREIVKPIKVKDKQLKLEL